MRRYVFALTTSAAIGLGAGSFASAADIAVKAPVYKGPEVLSENPYYVWLDGMYDSVHLPTYRLGLRALPNTFPSFDNGAALQPFDTHLNGGGAHGAVGYVLPGTSTRFEFGGSFVGASATNSQSTTNTNNVVVAQFLNGSGLNSNFNCIPGFVTCSTLSRLSTDYSAWQLNGKVASDWKYGSVIVTPSAAVFGGNSRVGQSLSQSFAQSLAGNGTGTYSASTTEKWTDVGGRIGVDINAPVTAALTVGIGGWVGGAARHTSLSGSDVGTTFGCSCFDGNSTLSISDSKAVFLANAEASFLYKFTQLVALRGFAGLNYDGGVPGIGIPSFGGNVFAPTSRTAASINYAQETSYYAGGGVLVKFGPK